MASVSASAPPAFTRSAICRTVGFGFPRSRKRGAVSMRIAGSFVLCSPAILFDRPRCGQAVLWVLDRRGHAQRDLGMFVVEHHLGPGIGTARPVRERQHQARLEAPVVTSLWGQPDAELPVAEVRW